MTRLHFAIGALLAASLALLSAATATAEPQSHIDRPTVLADSGWRALDARLAPIGGPGYVAPQSCNVTSECTYGAREEGARPDF